MQSGSQKVESGVQCDEPEVMEPELKQPETVNQGLTDLNDQLDPALVPAPPLQQVPEGSMMESKTPDGPVDSGSMVDSGDSQIQRESLGASDPSEKAEQTDMDNLDGKNISPASEITIEEEITAEPMPRPSLMAQVPAPLHPALSATQQPPLPWEQQRNVLRKACQRIISFGNVILQKTNQNNSLAENAFQNSHFHGKCKSGKCTHRKRFWGL